MEIIGSIFAIEEKQVKTDKFTVQEFILDAGTFDQYTGEKRENYLKLQCSNNRIEELEKLKIHDRVKVFFHPRGRFFKDKEGKDGHAQNLDAYKFEKL